MPVTSAYVARTSSSRMKCGMPSSPREPAMVSNTRCPNTSQARSISRGPIVAISQSRTPTGWNSR